MMFQKGIDPRRGMGIGQVLLESKFIKLNRDIATTIDEFADEIANQINPLLGKRIKFYCKSRDNVSEITLITWGLRVQDNHGIASPQIDIYFFGAESAIAEYPDVSRPITLA